MCAKQARALYGTASFCRPPIKHYCCRRADGGRDDKNCEKLSPPKRLAYIHSPTLIYLPPPVHQEIKGVPTLFLPSPDSSALASINTPWACRTRRHHTSSHTTHLAAPISIFQKLSYMLHPQREKKKKTSGRNGYCCCCYYIGYRRSDLVENNFLNAYSAYCCRPQQAVLVLPASKTHPLWCCSAPALMWRT